MVFLLPGCSSGDKGSAGPYVAFCNLVESGGMGETEHGGSLASMMPGPPAMGQHVHFVRGVFRVVTVK